MLCWEGEHRLLSAVASVFVLFYALLMPAAVAYALFVIGRDGARLNSAHYKARYGFVYLRYVCMQHRMVLLFLCAYAYSCMKAQMDG